MSMDFSTLKELKIPEGNVTKITDASGKVLWEAGPTANVFGVCWDTGNQSTALTRLTPKTDPYRFVTQTVTEEPKPAIGTGAGSSPFDAFMPWSGMQECNLNTAGTVTARKGDNRFSRYGDFVMVYIPEFYVAQKRRGAKQYFYVSDQPKAGFTKHLGSGKYVGKYHMNSNGRSMTNASPWVKMTRADARSKAMGIGSKFHLYDFVTYCAIIWLYLIEFADWDSQSKIGMGVVNASAAVNSGGTDSMSYHTGRAAGVDGKTAVQYRGVENLWGNVSQWVDGFNANGFNANGVTSYYCTDPSKYADDITTGYTNICTLPFRGYIKDLTVTDTGLLIPKTNGGSETTYIPDYVSTNSGGRVLSGGRTMGSDAGLLCFLASLASSGSGLVVSARVMCEA